MAEISALDQTISARRRQTRSSIYRYLYEAGVPCSKQQIAAALGLSLPTVYQNLTELTAAGLIGEAGMQPSSGGRPATQLSILADARLSAGVCITRQRLRFILTDLSRRELGYKDVRHQKDVSDPDYSAFLAAQLERFLDENGVDRGSFWASAFRSRASSPRRAARSSSRRRWRCATCRFRSSCRPSPTPRGWKTTGPAAALPSGSPHPAREISPFCPLRTAWAALCWSTARSSPATTAAAENSATCALSPAGCRANVAAAAVWRPIAPPHG